MTFARFAPRGLAASRLQAQLYWNRKRRREANSVPDAPTGYVFMVRDNGDGTVTYLRRSDDGPYLLKPAS